MSIFRKILDALDARPEKDFEYANDRQAEKVEPETSAVSDIRERVKQSERTELQEHTEQSGRTEQSGGSSEVRMPDSENNGPESSDSGQADVSDVKEEPKKESSQPRKKAAGNAIEAMADAVAAIVNHLRNLNFAFGGIEGTIEVYAPDLNGLPRPWKEDDFIRTLAGRLHQAHIEGDISYSRLSSPEGVPKDASEVIPGEIFIRFSTGDSPAIPRQSSVVLRLVEGTGSAQYPRYTLDSSEYLEYKIGRGIPADSPDAASRIVILANEPDPMLAKKNGRVSRNQGFFFFDRERWIFKSNPEASSVYYLMAGQPSINMIKLATDQPLPLSRGLRIFFGSNVCFVVE